MSLVKLNDESLKKLTQVSDYTAEQIQIIQNTVAKNTTPMELSYFLSVCHTVGLNPFIKEIWCYKMPTKRGDELMVFAGRDGFLKKAQENPYFNGIRSCEIREKDEFYVDVANNKIHHKITAWGADRGSIKGAYAIVFRKDGEPTIEIADFQRYNKNQNVWNSHPEAMIKKVAEVNALKKAFGISGIQSEHDFEFKDNMAIPLSNKKTLLEEVEFFRAGENDLAHEDWIAKVSMDLLEKERPDTQAEKKVFIDRMSQYDVVTGDKLVFVDSDKPES